MNTGHRNVRIIKLSDRKKLKKKFFIYEISYVHLFKRLYKNTEKIYITYRS